MSIFGYRCDNIKDNVNVFKGGRDGMKEAKKVETSNLRIENNIYFARKKFF